MPTAAIKICGISTPDTLEATIRARAAHIGLVFFTKSPRAVTPAQAAALAAQAQGRIGRVGLFVDADDGAIADAVVAAKLDALQLHGKETPERTGQLRARFGLPVWKALSVATAADVARADAYAGAADLILFDAKTPRGALPGGVGLSFDWSLVAHWKGPIAWGLAGGLTADTVAQAVRLTGAPLVDTSSGVESAPGVKDEGRIAAFCAAVRAVEQSAI
ncbi:phosphoribosylanthranilate isomerase [Novosphingobium sp. Rr 2-17]|uniref:phosphoribosylanthranilate isomerase n=1 Tax=Novosphingobium sp. Rr 2-17 TaxID=555793 RepID=UPI000269A484|nr:phosphoribosylanthranilate isomerase [Novosphingobium sp. Rr 2-17]EIZ81313.1 phosphoribosylanthranilate isomerase [Novosphingobium sp. Rr 2-17]